MVGQEIHERVDYRKEYIIVFEAFTELEQGLKPDDILLRGRYRRIYTARISGPVS